MCYKRSKWTAEQQTEELRKDVDKAKVTSNVYLHVLSTGHPVNFFYVCDVGKSNNVRI